MGIIRSIVSAILSAAVSAWALNFTFWREFIWAFFAALKQLLFQPLIQLGIGSFVSDLVREMRGAKRIGYGSCNIRLVPSSGIGEKLAGNLDRNP